jgi:dTDP-glucose 4,6-dehydratase
VARVLVTGGAGFIGCNFVHYWTEVHPDDSVIVLDALTYAGNRANLQALEGRKQYRFVHGNICDTRLVENLLREAHIDTIVNFAAESHVDRSIIGPDEFITTNVVGTHSLLKAARTVWLQGSRVEPHRFHHVSTDETYGSLGPTDRPFSESSPYAPNSPYAASKAASDHLVRAYHRTYGMSATVSNCSNNYGPYQFPEKLIPVVILSVLDGESVPVYGDGRNIRDWMHVVDHCKGIERVLSAGVPGEVYNIGAHSECENLTLVKMLCAILDEFFEQRPELRRQFPDAPSWQGRRAASLIEFVNDRPGHDRRYAIDSTKIERHFGFQAATPLREGLRETVAWYLGNEAWWRMIQQRRQLVRW